MPSARAGLPGLIALTSLLLLLLGSRVANAEPTATANKQSTASASGLGLGIAIGHPSGLTVKKHLASSALAIQGGLGSGMLDGHGLHVHLDLLWSPAVLKETPHHRIPLYVGAGARIYDHFYDRVSRYEAGRDTHLGLRIPVGLAIELNETPIDFFVEAAVVADLLQSGGCNLTNATSSLCAHDQRLEVHLAIGGRYYFGR